MAVERKDRIKDQWSGTGTGTITLDLVAPTGYRTMTTHTTGATVNYLIIDSTGLNWEVGQGVWTSASQTLTRATVFASSNANALVSFETGIKTVATLPTANDFTNIFLNPTVTALQEVRVAMAANNVDLTAGNWFTKTIAAPTTFTISNVPAAGTAASFVMELTNAGSQTITWPTGTKWAGGVAPTLTVSGVDILGFYTHDGGTTWRGLTLEKTADK